MRNRRKGDNFGSIACTQKKIRVLKVLSLLIQQWQHWLKRQSWLQHLQSQSSKATGQLTEQQVFAFHFCVQVTFRKLLGEIWIMIKVTLNMSSYPVSGALVPILVVAGDDVFCLLLCCYCDNDFWLRLSTSMLFKPI